MKVTLCFEGGAEALFDNVKQRTVDMSVLGEPKEEKNWTLGGLVKWLRHSSGFLTGNGDLFFTGDSLRNGIMVLINDTDWELVGELDYELQNGDEILFISSLHGG